MTVSHIERIEEIIVPGMRLGRHVHLAARMAARPYDGPKVPVVPVTWDRKIPILDQGEVGSCTGNAMTGALGTENLFDSLPAGHPVLDESEALSLYSAAEVIDGDGPYPPNDNGSTGPSVAQAAKNAGLISDFSHYTDIDSTLQMLMKGPVIVGVNWYSSFDRPAADGTVVIGGYIRGGHEVMARVVDAANQMIGFDNSWGVSWGASGSFKMSYSTLSQLLSEGGDCTSFLALPSPSPVPPTPPPSPGKVVKPDWWPDFVAYSDKFFA